MQGLRREIGDAGPDFRRTRGLPLLWQRFDEKGVFHVCRVYVVGLFEGGLREWKLWAARFVVCERQLSLLACGKPSPTGRSAKSAGRPFIWDTRSGHMRLRKGGSVHNPATFKSQKNEGTPLRSQRQNDFIIVIARHEVPGAISSEERFARGSIGIFARFLG